MLQGAAGLSFIIPAYNEEGAVTQTITRLHSSLLRLDLPFEIIVVNDGSQDGTGEALRNDARVQVINHPVNVGYGRSLKTGILAARYPWIGIVDADSTYDIELVPEMIERMKRGFHMVVAARKNVLELDQPLKRLLRKLMVSALNIILAANIKDPNSGLRIFRRDMAMMFMPFLCNRFSFTTSITVFALGSGCFVDYVPMNYSPRDGTSKVQHLRDSLRMIQLIVQGVTFFNPVKLVLMLIVALVLFGGIPAVLLAVAGLPLLAAFYLFLTAAGSVLFVLGVVADIMRVTSTTELNDTRLLVHEMLPRTADNGRIPDH